MEEQTDFEKRIEELMAQVQKVKEQVSKVEIVPWRKYQWISNSNTKVEHPWFVSQSSH